MSDLPSSLISWIKLQGCVDSHVEVYQQIDDFDQITDTFETMFPHIELDQNDKSASLIQHLLSTSIDLNLNLNKFTMKDVKECTSEALEAVFTLMLFLEYKSNSERLDAQLSMLPEKQSKILRDLLTGSPESDRIMIENIRMVTKLCKDKTYIEKMVEELKQEGDDDTIDEGNILQKEQRRIDEELKVLTDDYEKIKSGNTNLEEEVSTKREMLGALRKEREEMEQSILSRRAEALNKKKGLEQEFESLKLTESEYQEMKQRYDMLKKNERKLKAIIGQQLNHERNEMRRKKEFMSGIECLKKSIQGKREELEAIRKRINNSNLHFNEKDGLTEVVG